MVLVVVDTVDVLVVVAKERQVPLQILAYLNIQVVDEVELVVVYVVDVVEVVDVVDDVDVVAE